MTLIIVHFVKLEFLSNISRYGLKLVRTDCTHYTGGSVIVVSRLDILFLLSIISFENFVLLGVHRMHGT